MIIGLTGLLACGKDTIGAFFQKKGFIVCSLSDVIRDECKSRNIELTRDNLQAMGNELRTNFGPSVLSERLIAKMDSNKNYVITSIRNPKEIEPFEKISKFHLIYVDVNPEIRYNRAKSRAKENEHVATFEEFISSEKKELDNKDPNSQQLLKCKEMAKYILDNNSTLENLENNIEQLLLKIQIENRNKPEWDSFFLNIAKEHALRSNCLSARMGAVITVNNIIVSSGYTGAPRKTKDCYSRGYCIRRKNNVPSGQRYELCASVHAEQNAIINAARNGAKIEGGTLYLYSEKSYLGIIEPVDAFPCFICKKMLINAGIEKVICSQKDGSYKSYNVSDWIEDWKENDIANDMMVYKVYYK